MRLSLPVRIFCVHLAFIALLGGLGVLLVRDAFDRYKSSWERELDTHPAETLFSPLVSEVARALLLKVEQGPPERRSRILAGVTEGLDEVLPTLPSIDRLLIVDRRGTIHYFNDASGLALDAPDLDPATLETDRPVQRALRLETGEPVLELVLPVDEPAPVGGVPRRLGAVLVRYRETDAAEVEPVAGRSRAATPPDPSPLWLAELGRLVLAESEPPVAAAVEGFRRQVSAGLSKVLDTLPLESLVIVDRERRIQYVSDPKYLDLTFADEDKAALLGRGSTVRREVTLASGRRGIEIMLPVFDRRHDADETTVMRRLGSVLIRYRPDPELAVRIPDLLPPEISPRDYTLPLIPFLLAGLGGGVLLAALTGVPVRRLERALAEFRARGFKGGLDPSQVPRDLASTVQTISELGGRLEALDAKGREREALLEKLSGSLEDAMVVLDAAGTPVSWNRAALRMLLARVADDATTSEGEARTRIALGAVVADNPALRAAIESGRAVEAREGEIVRPDGSRTRVRVTAVPLETGPGLEGTLLLLRDLATLRDVEGHLLDAGRFAVLAHLAAGMAHEIRNPLHAIQVNASVVQQYATVSADRSRDVEESLSTIQEEAQRLTDLLNNYLGLVRSGDEPGPVDLRLLSGKVIQLVSYAARRSKVEIRLEGDPHPPAVHGVANRLQQAILNLVLNAIQAMPGGGEVRLAVEAEGPVVRLEIRDTGPGLPQGLAEELFDTRITTKPGGAGLGLPLVRMIVESHGGEVHYRPAPGQGACFVLSLPAA